MCSTATLEAANLQLRRVNMKRKMYYVMSFTWGLPLTLCGLIVALFLLVTGHRPRRYHGCLHFELGRTRWGGLNLGPVLLTQREPPEYLVTHELGHAVQNTKYGPGMIPLVIRSVCRYHVHNWKAWRGLPVPSYYSDWFEAQASEYGQAYTQTRS